MILLDANLLIHAHVQSQPEHDRARPWLEAQLSGRTRVGLPWPSLLAFVRLVSNPRIFPRPTTVPEAWIVVESWLRQPATWIPAPTDAHREVLGDLLRHEATRHALVPDAHLAALAIEHGLTLCSSDRDFARFTRLRWENPLA